MIGGPGGTVPTVVGLDVGSTTAKIAVPSEAHDAAPRAAAVDGANSHSAAQGNSIGTTGDFRTKVVQAHRWKELMEGIPGNASIVSTGYFRRTVPHNLAVTEITAAIHGTLHFIPGADLIIDIGGQDVKVIDPGTSDFQLNDKCSAGTGAFLELVAGYFEIDPVELSQLHSRARRIAPVNQTCGVFAISEMISGLVEGYTMEEVVAGVHHAFARRISHLVRKEAREVVAIGGVSRNGGVISALSEVLGKEVKVPEEPQIVNAVGAALYGTDSAKRVNRGG